MKTTLEIKRLNAINAFNKADENGKKLLKDLFGSNTFNLNYKDIKSYEDACAFLGKEPVDFEELNDTLENNGFEPLPEHEIAYKKLEIIAKALNFGWCPNWADFDECKYYPWFDIKKETPAGVGGAYYGAALGVSVLRSDDVASYSRALTSGVPLLPKIGKSQSISAISLPKFGNLTFCLYDRSLTGCRNFLHP